MKSQKRSFARNPLGQFAVLLWLGYSLAGVAWGSEIHKTYYPSGALKAELSLKNGCLHGPVKWYYESGALGALMEYRQNRLHGIAKTYYEDGTLKRMTRWSYNHPEGWSKVYSPEGRLVSLARYRDGRLILARGRSCE